VNFKIVFSAFFLVFFACKKENKETFTEENTTIFEIATNKTASDSVKINNTVSEKLKPPNKNDEVKEVVIQTIEKTDSINGTNKIDETINNRTTKIDSSRGSENINNVTVEKEDIKNQTAAKEATEPIKKPILKAGITYINAREFKKKIEGNNTQLIDVRTPREFTDEHLNGAININYYKKALFHKEMAKLDKSKPVYVYCRSGVRSSKSAKILKKAGFKVYDLKGGILDWKSNNLETKK